MKKKKLKAIARKKPAGKTSAGRKATKTAGPASRIALRIATIGMIRSRSDAEIWRMSYENSTFPSNPIEVAPAAAPTRFTSARRPGTASLSSASVGVGFSMTVSTR